MTELSKRAYGWKKQKHDKRDLQFLHLIHHFKAQALPPVVDMRPQCPPVYNQGSLGSCTANAIAFLCEKDLMAKAKPEEWTPSRLFIYYNERALEGNIEIDAGANLRDGIKTLARWGFPPETIWPYDIAKFAHTPPAPVYAAATKEIVRDYGAVQQVQTDMQTCLASGFPIVIGFLVYESFESAQVAKTGVVPMPTPGEQILGGHAVCIVGYNAQGWIVRNSWGPNWGQAGYFIMPYAYFTDPELSSDLWCVRMVP